MSYNIDTIEIVKADAYILAGDARALLRKYGERLPSECFLHAVKAGLPAAKPVPVERLGWYGEGSGRAWHEFFPEVAAKIHGRLEAILIWEGGDAITGLRIVDGRMTEPAVTMTLAPE